MKNVIRYLLIMIFASTGMHPLFAQWVQAGLPGGGSISSLARIDTALFAGTEGAGVFISTDRGANWTSVNSGLTSLNVNALAAIGTNIYAATWDGMFLSSDNGKNWTSLNSPLFFTSAIWTIFANDSNIYVGTLGEGVYLSTNSGLDWTEINTGLTNSYVRAFAKKDSNIFVGTDGGIFRTTNNGTEWSEAGIGLTNTNIYALSAIGSNLYAGTLDSMGGGIIFSSDNGATWHTSSIEPYTYVYSFACGFSGMGDTIFFAGTNGKGVFRSTDSGASWSKINTGLAAIYVPVLMIDDSRLFAGTEMGVFITDDDGAHWSESNAGLSATEVHAFDTSGSNIYAATWSSGVFVSTNEGMSWTRLNATHNMYNISSLVTNDSNIFVGTLGEGLFVSTDNGNTWSNKGLKFVYTLAFDSSYLFAGTSGGIFRSTDNGLNWTAVNNGLTDSTVWNLAVYNNSIYAGTNTGDVFISGTHGSSWTSLGVVSPTNRVRSIVVCDTNIYVGTEGGGIILSTNGGANWVAVNSGVTDLNIYDLAVYGKDIFAGTRFGGIFLSTDNGNSWVSENAGLTNSPVYALMVINDDLFAGMRGFRGSIWIRPLSEMVTDVKEHSSIAPNKVSLSQNYPNPFNPMTTINYQLSMSSHVSLKIYDVLGREVATLVSRDESAGYKSVKYDGRKLPSGVYFYRLETGSYHDTKKFLLLK
jgi:photosystem II stability/assembly factor-like uncharacterized protein